MTISIESIRRDCSKAIDQFGAAGKVLFSGTKTPVTAVEQISSSATPGRVRLRPNQDATFEDAFNGWLKRRYGKKFPARTGALFSVASYELASRHGNVCLLFPCNESQVAFSPTLNDPYFAFEKWGASKASGVTDGVTRDRFSDARGDMYLMMVYCQRHASFRRAIETHFFSQHEFVTGEFVEALDKKCEIWIHGSCYCVPLSSKTDSILTALGLDSCIPWVQEEIAAR